jgi:hypothetical protein
MYTQKLSSYRSISSFSPPPRLPHPPVSIEALVLLFFEFLVAAPFLFVLLVKNCSTYRRIREFKPSSALFPSRHCSFGKQQHITKKVKLIISYRFGTVNCWCESLRLMCIKTTEVDKSNRWATPSAAFPFQLFRSLFYICCELNYIAICCWLLFFLAVTGDGCLF